MIIIILVKFTQGNVNTVRLDLFIIIFHTQHYFTHFRPANESTELTGASGQPTKSSSDNSGASPPRRESLGNIQNFLKTLAYWKRQPPATNRLPSSNKKTTETGRNAAAAARVERSKSFSIKCDKGYSTYYQIEPKRTVLETSNLVMHDNMEQAKQPAPSTVNKFSDFHEVGLPLQPIHTKRYYAQFIVAQAFLVKSRGQGLQLHMIYFPFYWTVPMYAAK